MAPTPMTVVDKPMKLGSAAFVRDWFTEVAAGLSLLREPRKHVLHEPL
jgi:hypothetical protein